MTDLNLNELRKVAEAATEGPWDFEAGGEYQCGEPGCCTEYWDNRIWGEGIVLLESHMLSTEDATHIATFDPPTVLALLDRVAELEAKVARVEALAEEWEPMRWSEDGVEYTLTLDGPGGTYCHDLRAALAGESDE